MNANSTIALVLLALTANFAGAGDETKPVRIGSGVSGHIHPAACVSKNGTVIVTYCKTEAKDHLIARSNDGGLTWTRPEPFEPTAKLSIYPGSLTTLADGRIVHAWNTWYGAGKEKSRFVQFSISSDDGKTWSEPKSLPKNPVSHSVIRHPLIELGPRAWLFSLMDQTLVYDPATEKVAPFADGQKHGLVPMIKTTKGTFVSGAGKRSVDEGKSWEKIAPFPKIAAQGWRHEMVGLSNSWLLASDIDGEGIGGGTRIRFVVSKDDGKTWGLDNGLVYYNPGRMIGGRACPRTVEIDAKTIGTVFYDIDAKQPGGAGVFFLRTPLTRFK